MSPTGRKTRPSCSDELARVPRRLAAGEVAGRRHQEPVVGAERHVDDAGERHRQGADGDVEALLERVHRPVDEEELDRHPGVRRREAGERLAHDASDGGRGLDPQVAAEAAVRRAAPRAAPARTRPRAPAAAGAAARRRWSASGGGWCGRRAGRRALLQPVDALGQDRCRGTELAAGGGEAAGAGGDEEGLDIRKLGHGRAENVRRCCRRTRGSGAPSRRQSAGTRRVLCNRARRALSGGRSAAGAPPA